MSGPPTTSSSSPVNKKHANSVVWYYFKEVNDGSDNDIVKCVLCETTFSLPQSGTTSGLIAHIRYHHRNEPPPIKIPKRQRYHDRKFKNRKYPKVCMTSPKKNNSKEQSLVWKYYQVLEEDPCKCRCTLCGAQIKFRFGHSRITSPLIRHLETKHSETTFNLRVKKKGRSLVWKYYQVLEEDPCKCRCTFCGAQIKFRFGHSKQTTSLIKHLKTKHSKENIFVKNVLPSKSLASAATASTSDEIKHTDEGNDGSKVETTLNFNTLHLNTQHLLRSDKNKIHDAVLLQMIASNLQPFSFMEDKSFYDWASALNPNYNLPSSEKMSKELLPQVYEQVQQDVRLSLQNVDKLTLSLECWKSWSSKQFVTVTAHFLTLSWEKKTFVLFTFQVFNGMTSIQVASEFKNHLMLWKIQDKVFSVVMEMGSTALSVMVDAIHHLELEIVPCFVHSLDNLIKDALRKTEDVAVVTNRVRKNISCLQYVGDGINALKTILKDDEDRWSSTLNMFRCYMEQHEAISTSLDCVEKSEYCIDDRDVCLMKKIVDILEPFELAADELSIENQATCSVVIPMLKQLLEFLSDFQCDDDFELHSALAIGVNTLTSSLESNFMICATTVLDPRFKFLPFSDPEKKKYIENCLTSSLKEMSKTALADRELIVPKSQISTDQPRKSLWNRFDLKVKTLTDSSAVFTTFHTLEVRRYLEFKQPKREEVHPADWWKSNYVLTPNLSKLAQQFLAIPASSVPGPLVFSKNSDRFIAQRSCLDENIVDKMLFLNKNYNVAGQRFDFLV